MSEDTGSAPPNPEETSPEEQEPKFLERATGARSGIGQALLVPTLAILAALIIGALIIATLETGLAQMGASEPLKRVITGLVIVGAASLDALRNQVPGGLAALLRAQFNRPISNINNNE